MAQQRSKPGAGPAIAGSLPIAPSTGTLDLSGDPLADQLRLWSRAEAIADQQRSGVPLAWIDDWEPWRRDLARYERWQTT